VWHDLAVRLLLVRVFNELESLWEIKQRFSSSRLSSKKAFRLQFSYLIPGS